MVVLVRQPAREENDGGVVALKGLFCLGLSFVIVLLVFFLPDLSFVYGFFLLSRFMNCFVG